MDKICAGCTNPFEVRYKSREMQRFCSRKCWYASSAFKGWDDHNRDIIWSNDKIFCIDSRAHRSRVKARIMRDKLIPYACKECGQPPEFRGKELVLQIEHINGNNGDNRLENLCFLCPNCHSQTETYAGRNIRKKRQSS